MEERRIASYLEELPNGNVLVKTKDGEFEIEDISGVESDSVARRCVNNETNGMLAASIVAKDGEKTKLNEEAVSLFKTSTRLKLGQGMNLLYGLEDTEQVFQNGGKG